MPTGSIQDMCQLKLEVRDVKQALDSAV
jgi:hypothetical protein